MKHCKSILALLPLALGSLASTACNQLTTHPDIYIDDSFTPEEMAPLMYGVTSWERNTEGKIHPTIHIMKHIDAFNKAASKSNPGQIIFLRFSAKENEQCPASARILHGEAANTHHYDLTGESNICFDADQLNSAKSIHFDPEVNHWAVWSISAAHEMGHALGLPHNPSDHSIMFHNVQVYSYDVTCEDVRSVCITWFLDIPQKCKE